MLSHRFGNILLLHKKKPPHQGTASPRNKVPCPRDKGTGSVSRPSLSIIQSANLVTERTIRHRVPNPLFVCPRKVSAVHLLWFSAFLPLSQLVQE
mgnify:CR=1 FL=1